MKEIFEGVYKKGDKIYTINLTPGKSVYGEELIKEKGIEYRFWNPWRSKPAAAIHKGLKVFPLKRGMKILYLGIASGTTASHFSDIIGKSGVIYGVDIAERVLQKLLPIAELRGNIIPILGNARKPESYEQLILGKVDLVYEDVASEDQIPILIRNSDKFLRKGGYAMIAIKSQSISSTKPVGQIYKECISELEKKFEILDKVELDPYEKFHLFVVLRLV